MRYTLADIQERMFNRPVAVTRDRAQIALGVMGPRLNVGSLVIEGEKKPIGALVDLATQARVEHEGRPGDQNFMPRDWETGRIIPGVRPYELWNGVGIFKVRGTLMAEGGLDPESGATAYNGLDYKRRFAEADDETHGILLDIDSGGGEVIDLLELCGHFLETREKKPIRAIVRGMACSAAYALASCATEISCAAYSWTGSIGCIMMHADFSKALEQDGIAVTLISSAPHKADAHRFLPLEEEVQTRLQSEVDKSAAAFVAHVAAARPKLSADSVRAQEARFYGGEEALRLGLVDKIMGWDESLKEFAETVNRRHSPASTPAPGAAAPVANRERAAMSAVTPAPGAEAAAEFTQATQDAAVAAARTAATSAERARVTAVIEADAESAVSEAAMKAIGEGTSAGDFALELAKGAKAQQQEALAAAKADAPSGDDLPGSGAAAAAAGGKKPNRGTAVVERLRGSHKGLPKEA